MASDAQLAKLLSHIAACRTAQLPGRRLVFCSGPHHLGYVLPEFAAAIPEITVFAGRAELPLKQLPNLNAIARNAGLRLRNEDFDVREAPDGPALATLDRGALPSFGVIGMGVHLNGLVRRADGLHLWVARRAAHKKLDPGKLDHLVAGGVSAGLTPLQTLLKESEEEASLPPAFAAQAVEAARFTYNMEREEGLRRDVIIAYDLELPPSFTPIPADGEVEYFELWPLEKIQEILSTTDDFKFNVTLVLIDLLIRHHRITGPAAAQLRLALSG